MKDNERKKILMTESNKIIKEVDPKNRDPHR